MKTLPASSVLTQKIVFPAFNWNWVVVTNNNAASSTLTKREERK